MKVILLTILVLLFAIQNGVIADDECQFDQENQIEVLKQLQKKYE